MIVINLHCCANVKDVMQINIETHTITFRFITESDAVLIQNPSDIANLHHALGVWLELNASESERNQCDGCQAGIPIIRGWHRMGKPGGYSDLMICTAKLYRQPQPATAKVDERAEFEAWWESEMNTEVFDLHRCNFPMQKPEFEQPYACGDTERGWLSWQARAKLEIK